MVIVLSHHITTGQKQDLTDFLQKHGYTLREVAGSEETIIGALGPAVLNYRDVEAMAGVERVIPISKPYKLVSRELNRDDLNVRIGNVTVGGGRIAVFAGPAAVESSVQITTTASLVRDAGAVVLTGGSLATSMTPYAFPGLGLEGLELLKSAGNQVKLPVVCEISDKDQLDDAIPLADALMVGPRHMQNTELLKALGASGVPVILKRGLAAGVEDWLMAAEYIAANGNEKIILCERGIKNFESTSRASLDLSSVPILKSLCRLPVIVEPGAASAERNQIPALGLAAAAAGADGILVEVHPDPANAKIDAAASLYPDQFDKLVRDLEALAPVLHKELCRTSVSTFVTGDTHGELSITAGEAMRQVAFQGAPGAYSEHAARRYFSDMADAWNTKACEEFADVFDAVLSGEAAFGVLPIENALTGSIHENYDLLLQYPDISICGETRIRIQHSLIARPDADLDDIRVVISHPQGLAQCARFLDGYPQIERRPFYDTAGSVRKISQESDRTVAAIAHSSAAAVYGMKVLQEGIETNPVNYTRFFVIRRNDGPKIHRPGCDKASIVFSAEDRPGALLSCMDTLSARGLNLTKIESRPIHGKPWEYMFYLDVDLGSGEGEFYKALDELGGKSSGIRVLGTYAAG